MRLYTRVVVIILFSVVAVLAKAQDPNPIMHNAIRIADSIKQQLQKPLPDSVRVNLLIILGRELQYINPPLAISYFTQAIKINDRYNNEIKRVGLLNDLGSVYQVLHDFPNALLYRFQALRIAERLGLEKEQADVLNNIGSTYMEIRQYSLAKKYMQDALRKRVMNHQHEEFAMIYSNLGAIAGLQGKPYECIAYCMKSIEMKQLYAPDFSLTLPYGNIGHAYVILNKLKLAASYYEKALKEAETMEDIVDCYINMGNLYLKGNDLSNAIANFTKAEQLIKENKIKNLLPELYKNMAAAYAKQQHFSKAYEYKEKLSDLMDEAFNERVTKQMNEMQVKYESEKKDKEIQLINKDKQIAETSVRTSRLFFAGLLVTMLVISFVLIRNILLKQKVNKVLQEKNSLVEWQKQQVEETNKKLVDENILAKYEILKSKTNPHFLFNSLSTLASIMPANPRLAVEFIERFSELYRIILKTENLQLITLQEEMKVVDNYLYLQKVRFEENLELDIHIDPSLYHYAIPPFSIQMVIENAIKHNALSSQRKLIIHVKANDQAIVITNNLQKKYSAVVSTGIGQKNISDRYRLIANLLPTFVKTETEYIVTLPLIKERNLVTM